MDEMIKEKNPLSIANENMEAYFKTHDVKYVTEDAVFKHMGTGDEYQGREEIAGMLHFMYHIAFDAKASFVNRLVTADKAMVEGFFTGKHIGEFAGLQPTNKEVNVPICVTYELENGLIKKAKIYMMGDVLMNQLS